MAITNLTVCDVDIQRRQPTKSLRHRLLRMVRAIEDMLERRRGRHALRRMNDYELRDIGVTRGDAYQESRKYPWQA